MREIPFVEPETCQVSEIEPHRRFPLQLFPPRIIEAAKRYRFDEKLKNDPVEYQRIYEELKIEAALTVIVCIFIPSILGPEPDRYFTRTPHTQRSALWSTTTMIQRYPRAHSELGLLEQSSLRPGMTIVTESFEP